MIVILSIAAAPIFYLVSKWSESQRKNAVDTLRKTAPLYWAGVVEGLPRASNSAYVENCLVYDTSTGKLCKKINSAWVQVIKGSDSDDESQQLLAIAAQISLMNTTVNTVI